MTEEDLRTVENLGRYLVTVNKLGLRNYMYSTPKDKLSKKIDTLLKDHGIPAPDGLKAEIIKIVEHEKQLEKAQVLSDVVSEYAKQRDTK